MTYKEEKEAWVSNCTGGSIGEVFLIASSCVVSHVLWLSLCQSRFINPNTYFIQFMIYVVPAILTQTLLANQALQLLLGMVCVSLNMVYRAENYQSITSIQQRMEKKKEETQSAAAAAPTTTTTAAAAVSDKKTKQLSYKTYLTVYRAASMILTCIAILAVDFPVFPRRFAKVETFGTSLMDLGVGSFVFSSGVVASRAYSKSQSFQTQMVQALRSSLPLLALGAARFLLTTGVDYQLHNSEYGLHWNFFITLGMLPPFVTLLTLVLQHLSFSYLGCVVVLLYQYLLSLQELQPWILEAPRVDLLSANKEGVCSFLGYLAIFLFGLDSGCILFHIPSRSVLSQAARAAGAAAGAGGSASVSTTSHATIPIQLTVRSFVYWAVFGIWLLFTQNDTSLQVSRRLANLPYVTWVVAFNLTLLTILIFVEQRIKKGKEDEPLLLNAINFNGLATFLLANVLTGVVNLSIKTLYASTTMSMTILVCYMMLVTFIPWLLWKHSIQIKL